MDFMDSEISLQQIQQIDFPLKKLYLSYVTNLFGSDVNITEFLKAIGNTLKELKVTLRYHQSRALHESIFKHLHKLQILNIDMESAPNKKSNDFYNSLGINSSIKTLILRTYNTKKDQRVLRGFVTNLPSLETLIIDGGAILNKYLRLISGNLHQLKQLNFKAASGGVFKKVSLPNVTTLHLTVAWPSERPDWTLICRAFPNIKNLSLEALHDIDFDSISVLTHAWKKSLRFVFMGGKFKADTQKVKLFFKNCEHIEKLYLSEKAPGIGSKALQAAFPKIIYSDKSFVRGAYDLSLRMAEK